MSDYRCGNCFSPCEPMLHEVGLTNDCCPESVLLVLDGCEARTLTDKEESKLIEELWSDLSPRQRRSINAGNQS